MATEHSGLYFMFLDPLLVAIHENNNLRNSHDVIWDIQMITIRKRFYDENKSFNRLRKRFCLQHFLKLPCYFPSEVRPPDAKCSFIRDTDTPQVVF